MKNRALIMRLLKYPWDAEIVIPAPNNKPCAVQPVNDVTAGTYQQHHADMGEFREDELPGDGGVAAIRLDRL